MTTSYREVVGWHGFPDYPGYRVGDDGSVWSRSRAAWRRLSPNIVKGHPCVRFYRGGKAKTFYVRTLVLRAFVGPCPLGFAPLSFPDPDTRNCRLENLRWAPKGASRLGSVSDPDRVARGEATGTAALSEPEVRAIRRLAAGGEFNSVEIAESFSLSPSHVRKVARGAYWAHVGGPRVAAGGFDGHRGERHVKAKVTAGVVVEIRAAAREGASYATLMARYGLSKGGVADIVRGKNWKHVPGALPARNGRITSPGRRGPEGDSDA